MIDASEWPPCPLTAEDYRIWRNLCVWCFHRPAQAAGRGIVCAESLAKASDQKDYRLMLVAQQIAAHGPAAIQLEGIDCRGWTQSG